MRFRHIEVFQAVMETGSMSAAGRLIHLTQSAVSRLISSAEAQLGYPLFHRAGGRLIPTAEGIALFTESSDLFQRLEAFQRMAHHLKSGDQGTLRIGAIPAVCHKLLPDALNDFRLKHSQVICEVSTSHKGQLVHDLLTRDIDIGLDLFGVSHPGIVAKVVGSGWLYVMLSSQHTAAAQGCEPTAAEIREAMGSLPMIALLDDDPVMMSFSRYCALHGFRVQGRTRVQTSQLAEELVAQGCGWTIVDFMTAAKCGPLVRVSQLKPGIECTVNSFFSKNHAPPMLARKFLESVKKALLRFDRRKVAG